MTTRMIWIVLGLIALGMVAFGWAQAAIDFTLPPWLKYTLIGILWGAFLGAFRWRRRILTPLNLRNLVLVALLCAVLALISAEGKPFSPTFLVTYLNLLCFVGAAIAMERLAYLAFSRAASSAEAPSEHRSAE